MKSFLSACGLTDSLPLVVERQGAKQGELRLLHQPFALIGRDPRADVVLDHDQVSRRHVYLQAVDGWPFWVDLDGRSGTLVDGEVQDCGWLDSGRSLQVGPYIIRRFVNKSQHGTDGRPGQQARTVPLVAVAEGDGPFHEFALEFLNGPSPRLAWPVRRVLSLIGSASGCKFRLTDASVSRFHASLLRTSAGLWIVDLLGHRGIAVNEVPLRFSHLADGDRLRIGRYQIRIRCQTTRRRSAKAPDDRTRPRAATPPSHRKRDPNELMFPDWASDAPAFASKIEIPVEAQFPLAIRAFSSGANGEVSTPDAMVGLTAVPAELRETMLVPLVNQFGLMQQQMFDQFQQAMGMMVQMFGRMHHDQMAVIREELDQLRVLTEEFHALKRELAARTKDETGVVSSAGSGGLNAADGDATATIQPRSPQFGVSEQPSSPIPGRSSSVPQTFKPQGAAPLSDGVGEPGLRSQNKSNDPKAAADSERDSIVWVHQRIMALQRERETRWQKILKLLPGLS